MYIYESCRRWEQIGSKAIVAAVHAITSWIRRKKLVKTWKCI